MRSTSPVHVTDRRPPVPPPPPLDVKPLVRALEAGFAAVEAQVSAAFGEIERGCVELALAATARLVRQKAQVGELELLTPLKALLESRRREIAGGGAKLRVHPEDATLLAPKIAELATAGSPLEIVADASLARGSLSLELGAAHVVRTLAHDLALLRRQLLGEDGGPA